MRSFVQAVIKKFKLRRAYVVDTDLSPANYDLRAINNRVHRAMIRTGHTRAEIGELFGLDASIPLAMQPFEKIPRPTMGNIVKVSNFLGVSIRWLLYGEPQNDVDCFVELSPAKQHGVASSVQGSAVVQGNEQSTIIVKNIHGESLTEQEREALRLFRSLGIQEQTRLLCFGYDLATNKNEAPGA